ncbi:hypothetical protein [Williamsia sp. CHRR-6]|uniref:hypothetical protein n=1 Tax=Williamsia sp. CHRR-6 TaxID=2835871 RepID=UPI001BD932E5|nr:hypothetical protein [Williamsia sp. CHRR-6]MBT0565396.1 hypothetical protein [Williamsia sp. CHRR-6]
MNGIRTWWDGVEAWLTGLSFVPQLLVSLAVLIPSAIVAAIALNALVNGVMRIVERVSTPRSAGDRR